MFAVPALGSAFLRTRDRDVSEKRERNVAGAPYPAEASPRDTLALGFSLSTFARELSEAAARARR